MTTGRLAVYRKQQQQVVPSGPIGQQRIRRSPAPFSWLYDPHFTARSTRTFTDDEIDAFNQGLHRKRPKFIGKRHAPNINNSPKSDDVKAKVVVKRSAGPARKFLGRRRSSWTAGQDDIEDFKNVSADTFVPLQTDALDYDGDSSAKRSQMVPRRKFVGKRPASRKFVGRRNSWTVAARDGGGGVSLVEEEHRPRSASPKSWATNEMIEDTLAERNRQQLQDDDKRAARKFVG